MRKSNVLIIAILAVASVFFLWLWYCLKFDLVDHPRDLVLTIIWWAVIVLVCVLIHHSEKVRRERLRTCFVAPHLVYNAEAGSVPIQGATIDTVQDILENLTYGFDIAEQESAAKDNPAGFYQLIVRTSVFSCESVSKSGSVADAATRSGAGAATGSGTGAADNVAAQSAVSQDDPAARVKEWKGEVAVAGNPNADPKPFNNRQELAALLS